MAKTYKVTFLDGTSQTFTRTLAHDFRAERIYGKDAGPFEVMAATYWAGCTGGRGDRAEFEAWVDTVEDWEIVSADAEEADPGPLAPAGDGSPEPQS